MAAKKARKKPPEKVVGALKGGRVQINKAALNKFLKSLKNEDPYVRFVARNAPFMRRSPILPV
jgi:hypothetical protein